MPIHTFIRRQSSGGLVLILAAVIALILNNSPLAWMYEGFLDMPMAIQVGGLIIQKPFLLWINDGLMAVFFFLIGLEIKREILEGELSEIKKALLPVIAALGGLLFPALIYIYFNQGNIEALHGWGIPVATDIAFALAVLSLVIKEVPASLKILLLSLAIIDDIAAIAIIAIFYTEHLSMLSLLLASCGLALAIGFNLRGVCRIAPYILVGVFMWICVLKSGVHATIAGVLLAFTIPLNKKGKEESLLLELKYMLHPWVAYFIMPIFAFANAGVPLSGISFSTLLSPLPIGIMAGLFIGKQVGVFLFIFLAVMLGICQLPDDLKWRHIYGLALLCGIGFTMSLFIGTLAFDDPVMQTQVRLSVLIASTFSAVCGYLVLHFGRTIDPKP